MLPLQETQAIDEESRRLTEEECYRILRLARSRARHAGLTGEDVEDCAFASLLHVLDYIASHLAPPTGWTEAWLFRCIDNWAKNTGRQERHRRSGLVAMSGVDEDRSQAYRTSVHVPSTPEALALRRDRIARLLAVVARLSPRERELFWAHFLEEEDIAALSAAAGCSRGAMRQRLRVLLKHLRALLAEAGITLADMGDY